MLRTKIQQKAQELVTKIEATKVATKDRLATDSQTVQAYGEVLANTEMYQRGDVAMGDAIVRSQMIELTALGNPKYSAMLERMAETFNEGGPDTVAIGR